MRATGGITALLAAASLGMAAEASAVPSSEVDPLIGVDGHGNTVPGPKVPFGFANPSPDTDRLGLNTSGYSSQGDVIGFSQTHVSGTGGGGKYGNFRVMPITGALLLGGVSSPKQNERAAPGYYRVGLPRFGVTAELTASRLAALHRYRFPAARPAHLVLDATSVVRIESADPQRALRAWVRVTGPRSFEGAGSFTGSFGPGSHKLYFAARLSRRPKRLRAFRAGTALPAGRERGVVRTNRGAGRVGVYASWPAGEARRVGLRIGLSFLSARKARRNLATQLGARPFKRVRGRAERAWRAALARIDVEGGSREQRRAFAAALYHSHVMPHDLSGENAWWRSRAPHYEDYFTLWDTFRTLHPLLTLVQPGRQADMVQSLVETYEHTGWLPDGRIAGNNGLTQVGSNGDVLVADALVKGLPGIDYATAYRALRKNADVSSRRRWWEGRVLTDYARLGYASLDERASASRTMEYAYNDFAVAAVAQALGDGEAAARYRARSASWENLWDPATRSVRPRHADGSFVEPYSPTRRHYGWEDPFYEGSGQEWSTFVPHDVERLIQRVGGDEAFVAWLDRLFESGGHDPANEPGFLAPWLYAHAGRPDRAAERVRSIVERRYGDGRSGLPGNDDAGALSSWYVWSAIGMFPNAGQGWYYVGSPLFARSRIELGGGRSFTVSAPGTSAQNRYVQSASLDGRPLERAWITHDELMGASELRLEMGPEPSGWGRGERPPSLTLRDP
jgi:predicted alpha-1,2-mannosidase